MKIRQCPRCSRVVSLHLDKYRCSWCHIWLKADECLEMGCGPDSEGDRAIEAKSPEETVTPHQTETVDHSES